MFEKWRSFRNQVDFLIRSKLQFERSLPEGFEIPESELKFQKELREFFDLLGVKDLLINPKPHWVVCDVGTKNFSIAPVIDRLFIEKNHAVKIHGIEIDGYRRLRNFYTRADYARYFAQKAREAAFHPMDFLEFTEKVDAVFLLNPFVTKEPLLAWGLPLGLLKPAEMFSHAYGLLKEKKGFMVLGCPSEEEMEVASQYALKAGFLLGEIKVWKANSVTAQKKSRFGRICYSTVENVSDSGKRGIV